MSDPVDWWQRRRRDPFRKFFSDEFFEEFDKLFEEMFKDVEKKFPEELIRERKLPDGTTVREAGPFIYGYSVTVGPDGKPEIREFGNIKPQEHGKQHFEITDKREPLVDIIEEDNKIRIIAEMPGVEKEQIKIELVNAKLQISVEGDKKYFKSIDLPAKVDPEQTKASYKNGILEVTLSKTKPVAKSGKHIKVE